jgi:uncharacterized protein (DUF1800 family)
MNDETLWSLRLGFSGKQSGMIKEMGLDKFLQYSFASKIDSVEPEFLHDQPKSIGELMALRAKLQSMSSEESRIFVKQRRQTFLQLKRWWINKMRNERYPLREKMVCFWHNHFVATAQKVKVSHWIYQLNMLLREHAFGNFRELTKMAIKSNAMVRYLDNVDNRRGQLNENLSRELLELFTLGIGQYTEEDIKNGAKALAGLGVGEQGARFRSPFEVNETLTYLGQTGRFKADDLIDIIFEQDNIPYLITRKLLQWFIYDDPGEDLVMYYGDYFREVDFEVQPLLFKIFAEEYHKENAASKIKDPLVYILQIIDELNITQVDDAMVAFFVQQQGMDLFNQPNVKGWEGGNAWLTSQIYLQRHKLSDLFCSGRSINRKTFEKDRRSGEVELQRIKVDLDWDSTQTSAGIIEQLTSRLLFEVDDNMNDNLTKILKYDFDPKSPNAKEAILRLFNHITKTPEYQLV